MIKVCWRAEDVKNVVQACRDRKFDRLWLLRGLSDISLSTPDLEVSTSPGYLGPGCLVLYGNDEQPFVNPISIFHKTLKIIHKMKAEDAGVSWVEFHFRDDEFRICLTARSDRSFFMPE
jgi:hypothetical protein